MKIRKLRIKKFYKIFSRSRKKQKNLGEEIERKKVVKFFHFFEKIKKVSKTEEMTNMKLASETEVTVVVVGDSRYSFYKTFFLVTYEWS
jgi:hypothetical protein